MADTDLEETMTCGRSKTTAQRNQIPQYPLIGITHEDFVSDSRSP
jgi:hypothetical protein